MKNVNQKGGELTGALLTDEVIESASNILDGRAGLTKGAQQFYAPEPLARFTADILERRAVCDLTAGDGSLIAEFATEQRFGVEIDQDQIQNARKEKRSYNSIQGDVQHVAPLLIQAGIRFPRLALNPPFGLKWKDIEFRGGAEVNSAVLTLEYARQLLDQSGVGLLVTGGDGGWTQAIKPYIDGLERKQGSVELRVVAVINVDDLWTETRVGNQLIVFGFYSRRYYDDAPAPEPRIYDKSLAQLNDELFVRSIKELIRQGTRTAWSYNNGNTKPLERKFKAVADEYALVSGARKRDRARDYDVYVEGSKLRINPRPFIRYAMARSAMLDQLLTLDKQPVTYLALNKARWNELLSLDEDGKLVINPPLKPRIEKMIEETEQLLTPLYTLKEQQRLGWLEDLEQIECVKTTEDEQFKEGEKYPLRTEPFKQVEIENNRPAKDKDGRPTLAQFRKERWILKIVIDNHIFYENKADIEYLIEHFNIPNPGTIEDKYPEVVAAWREWMKKLEFGQSWKFKAFQIEDLARLMVKGSGLLAWEQGLGKTLAGLTFAKLHIASTQANEQVLIICPADLIDQWMREAKKFFGITLIQLKNKRDFRECEAAGGNGWYITHYEAISRAGRIKPTYLPLEMRVGYKQTKISATREWDETKGEYVEVPESTSTRPIFRDERCPRCDSSPRQGYNPGGTCEGFLPHSRLIEGDEGHEYSSRCGWNPVELAMPANYAIIKNTFRHGILILDELTKIKADQSLISLAARAIKARFVLGMTGTPIKNYAPDAYWGLWKCLGDATPRFPFHYTDGQAEFESRFSTIEWRIDGRGNKQGRKRLPEVSNISLLWRLLAPNIIRRRKEETGEPIVERTFYPTLVPVGMSQRKNTEKWLKDFGSFFKEKFPDHPLVEKGLVDWMAPMLGMQAKLEYSATMPEADPDKTWWSDQRKAPEVSNWTPKNARVLELALHHAAQGDKVLIGSALKAPGRWFADELNKRLCTDEELEQGKLKALNILAKTEDEEDLKTMTPAQRAKVVREFQLGKAQVLVSSHALNLGHNLDKGSVVILTGLPWDYATFDQFIARVHRLTSEKAVKVYVVLAKGTIDERKWKLLIDKSSAANLALDGRLIEEQEEQINQAEIIDQMMKAGIPVTGDEVDEDELEAAWLKIKSPADLPELVLSGTSANDLTDLKEDEGDVPEAPDQDTEGDADEPADEGEPDEPDPTEAEPDPEVEVPDPVEDAVVESPDFILVSGRGRLAEIEAALYAHNTVLASCEFQLTGQIVALVECRANGGFAADAQAGRLQSFPFGALVYDDRDEVLEAYGTTKGDYVEREKKMKAVQTTIETTPIVLEVDEPDAEGMVDAFNEDSIEPEPGEYGFEGDADKLDSEPVALATSDSVSSSEVSDDYLVGF